MNLEQYIIEYQKEIENLDKVVEKIVLSKKGWLLGEMKKRLYNQGIDGNGRKMGTYSKRSITERKEIGGLTTGHVTLRRKGDWYKGMTIKSNGKFSFNIISEDWKNDKLLDMYGEAILEPTKEELNNFVRVYIDREIEELIRKLGNIES
jgi:hypothetical protein